MKDRGAPTSINFRAAIMDGRTRYGLTTAQLLNEAEDKQRALAELRVAISRLRQEKAGGLNWVEPEQQRQISDRLRRH